MTNMMFYIGPAIGVIVTVVSVIFMIRVFGGLAKANKEAARILSTGQPATGQIASVQQTGTYVNNNPQVSLLINVTPQQGAPYQAQLTKIVSMFEIPQYQVGAALDLRVDPANPMSIAIAGPLQPGMAGAPQAGGYAAPQPGFAPPQGGPQGAYGAPPAGYAVQQGYAPPSGHAAPPQPGHPSR